MVGKKKIITFREKSVRRNTTVKLNVKKTEIVFQVF